MTIRQVIDRVHLLRDPTIDDGGLLLIINQIEAEIERKIIHPRDAEIAFKGYSEENMDTELKVPFPFDDVYIKGCVKEIDARENQIANYNNSERLYKEVFGELAAWWTRTHRQPNSRMHSQWWGI